MSAFPAPAQPLPTPPPVPPNGGDAHASVPAATSPPTPPPPAAAAEAKPTKKGKKAKEPAKKTAKVTLDGGVYEKIKAKAARLEEAEDCEKRAYRLESEWLMKKAEAASAKKRWEEAVAKLRDGIRNGGDLLFPPTDARKPQADAKPPATESPERAAYRDKFRAEAKAVVATAELKGQLDTIAGREPNKDGLDDIRLEVLRTELKLRGGDAAAEAVADDAWRAVRIDSLEPKIKPAKLAILADHQPPILTMGDMAAWQEQKGEWWWKDIKGFGEGGAEQYADAASRYWAEHPQPRAEAPAPPAAAAAAAEPSPVAAIDADLAKRSRRRRAKQPAKDQDRVPLSQAMKRPKAKAKGGKPAKKTAKKRK